MEIKAENVTRTFGTKRAIDELNFILPEGVYGLLGDNGAGKSTLMRILVAIDHQTSGKVTFNGKDIFHMNDDYRNLVGYILRISRCIPRSRQRNIWNIWEH